MAIRPVFIPCFKKGVIFKEYNIHFDWHPGFSVQQKQKSILSLHASANTKLGTSNLLEISTKSLDETGILASAFNLMIPDANGTSKYSVESAFQSAKKFENGGPYPDIRKMASRDAKKDLRLKNSGKLLGFEFFGKSWELTPKTAFYDWLYITAVLFNKKNFPRLLNYDGFTDIEFNPQKSINCQARSAAIFVSAYKTMNIFDVISSQNNFLSVYNDISYAEYSDSNKNSLFNI